MMGIALTKASRIVSAGALLVSLASGAGVASAADWPAMGFGAERGRLTTETLGAGLNATATWRNRLPVVQDAIYHTLLASPAVADGFVVYGTYDNRLRGLRETDGALLWEIATSDTVFASPALYRGRAYAAALDGQLTAVNLADGSVAWKRDMGGTVYGAPTVADDALYVSVGNPSPALVRLRPDTGAVVWTAGGVVVMPQAIHSAPAVADGHVVVGSNDGVWRSFDAATGALQWTTTLDGVVQMTGALIKAGTVYLAPAGPAVAVHALDLATGQARAGWPLAVTLPADPLAGTRRRTAMVPSSLVDSGGGRLALQVRRDERVDTDANGTVDALPLAEFVVAIDTETAAVAWIAAGARAVAVDENGVPPYGLSATPAAFPAGGGRVLLAATSALEGKVRVLDGATGAVLSTSAVAGPTRGSPAVANGGLILGTDDGSIARLASTANQPPEAPQQQFEPAPDAAIDVLQTRLAWGSSLEPDGEPVTYTVRWDDDGEVLHDWDGEVTTAPEQTSVRPTGLVGGRTYTWAVRARDTHGALSAWSAAQRFQPVKVPPVEVAGRSYTDLGAALAAAAPGDTVWLGPGLYPLLTTLSVPAGVTLTGAAPHLTVLRGRGLNAAVTLRGGGLRSVTVEGASVGVRVDGGDDTELRNVILRDNPEAGLRVAAGARARVVSATLLRNGIGVDGQGVVDIRNTLATTNGVGLRAGAGGRIATRYSNVFGNTTDDRQQAQAGPGDLAVAIRFVDPASNDARLVDAQAVTDHGDPADPFDLEPMPNGGRINVGAFGNTPYAELSAPPQSPPPGAAPVADDAPVQPPAHAGGCAVAAGQGSPSGRGLVALLVAMFALCRRKRRR